MPPPYVLYGKCSSCGETVKLTPLSDPGSYTHDFSPTCDHPLITMLMTVNNPRRLGVVTGITEEK